MLEGFVVFLIPRRYRQHRHKSFVLFIQLFVVSNVVCSFYAPEGWHIIIDSSVRQSVRRSVRPFFVRNLKTVQGINIKLIGS